MENKNITVDKIVEICEGVVLSRGSASTVHDFCCDTRKIKKGDMFLSLKTTNKNEEKYIEEALQKGAIGCMTEIDIAEDIINKYKENIIIKVKDSITAIQNIAKYKRNLYDIPVIAITGSVGKTSTKDIIASVIEQKYIVNKTQGNYNNHIGVPLTILSWDEKTEAAVIEMGMNHLGEIEVLTKIAKPTIAVITNVGTAHIGILGSRENILKAKLEILKGLKNDGTIVINNDNDLLHTSNLNNYKKITYGIENKSNYMAYNIMKTETNSKYKINIDESEYEILVPQAGNHFIYNSLCSIAVGRILGIEMNQIIAGIKRLEITENRNEIKNINNLKIINDYYNASYDSMKASIEVLANLQSNRKIAILGDMLELGEFSKQLHKKVGEKIAENKIDILCTVGKLATEIATEAKKNGVKEVYVFENNNDCMEKIKKIIKIGDAILLKASNRMNFGEISKFLEREALCLK